MTMDFYPPRAERPRRGIRFLALALPIGTIGYWFASWSLPPMQGIASVFTGTPDATLLTALVGIAAGVGSLVYFTRRFSRPPGTDPR